MAEDSAGRPSPEWEDQDYVLDAEGRILRVGDAWDRTAQEAGAPELVASEVLGTVLDDHISDLPTRHLWQTLMHGVRSTGRPAEVPVRCDTPTLRRWTRVLVAPLEDGGFTFKTRLVRVERRPPVPLLDASRPLDPEHRIRMCGWCKRVAVPGEGWLEVEQAVDRLELFGAERLPEITHGLCPDCAQRMAAAR